MNKKVISILGSAVAVGLLTTACSDSSSNGGTRVEHSKKSKTSAKFYKVGEPVKVDNVVYTLKSVQKTDERNEFADTKPQNVIKVVYHVKNCGKEELSIGTDLNVYGPNNSKLKSYPINGQTLDTIAPGKESDVVTGFGTDKLGDFELQFKPLVSINKAAKFKINVK